MAEESEISENKCLLGVLVMGFMCVSLSESESLSLQAIDRPSLVNTISDKLTSPKIACGTNPIQQAWQGATFKITVGGTSLVFFVLKQ